MATEAGRTRAGEKLKWFPKDSPKGRIDIPPCFNGGVVQKSSASSPMPGGTFWSLILQSISMNSPTQQDNWPSQDWPKSNHISQISLLEQHTLLSKITFHPTHPEETDVGKRPGLWSWKRKAQKEGRELVLPTVKAKRASLVMSQCQGNTEDLRRLREDMPGHQKCPSSFGAPKASDTSYSASSWNTCREGARAAVLGCFLQLCEHHRREKRTRVLKAASTWLAVSWKPGLSR